MPILMVMTASPSDKKGSAFIAARIRLAMNSVGLLGAAADDSDLGQKHGKLVTTGTGRDIDLPDL